MPSPATDAATAREWRELGFFYDTSESERTWNFVGSRFGLLNFARLLRDYADNPHRAAISEHDHHGPYAYLKIVTWHEALITKHDIRGTQNDIRRLADLIEQCLVTGSIGQCIEIDSDYSQRNEFRLRLHLREDDFDPPSADPLLPTSALNTNRA
jgi:hypothetical protein